MFQFEDEDIEEFNLNRNGGFTTVLLFVINLIILFWSIILYYIIKVYEFVRIWKYYIISSTISLLIHSEMNHPETKMTVTLFYYSPFFLYFLLTRKMLLYINVPLYNIYLYSISGLIYSVGLTLRKHVLHHCLENLIVSGFFMGALSLLLWQKI